MPLHAEFRSYLAPELLWAALLSSVPCASVRLHDSIVWGSPSHGKLTSALAGSASTLVALHGLPDRELQDSPDHGLASFTRLRALTLWQTQREGQALQAGWLPASLQELTLSCSRQLGVMGSAVPPLLIGFSGLQNMRRLTLSGYIEWPLGSRDDEENEPGRLQLPLSLEVCAPCPVPNAQ